jgi:hypothetical protein
MDEAAFEELFRNPRVARYLEGEARRHFSCPEDQEDAIALAWARILRQPAGLDWAEYKRQGGRAIKNLYQRLLYHRKRVQEASLDTREGGKPSSALAELAQRALSGDW